MGKYAIILVISLIILLSYFVISTNRANTIATERNVETFAYNQAKNVSNSAAQIIVREIMEVKPSSRWNYLMNTESSSINPPPYYSDWRDWPELEGRYKIKSLAKSVEFADDILLVVSGEAHDRTYDSRIHLVRRTNLDPYFDYAVYVNLIDFLFGHISGLGLHDNVYAALEIDSELYCAHDGLIMLDSVVAVIELDKS